VMNWLADQGIAVPRVHDAGGTDIVMDRVDGPTLLEDLERRPWRLVAHARLLARLQARVNAVVAPEWFPARSELPEGRQVAHLDLHPMNVMLSEEGPVIIDWTNTAATAAGVDASLSFVLMSTFEVGSRFDRMGQRVLVESFSRARGRALITAHLATACRLRLDDAGVTDTERASVGDLLGRTEHRPS